MLADISMEVAIHLLVFDNVLAWIEMFASMFLYNVSCKHEHVSEAIAHMYAHIYAYIYIYAYICFKRTAERRSWSPSWRQLGAASPEIF
jgi:hypothetical protein